MYCGGGLSCSWKINLHVPSTLAVYYKADNESWFRRNNKLWELWFHSFLRIEETVYYNIPKKSWLKINCISASKKPELIRKQRNQNIVNFYGIWNATILDRPVYNFRNVGRFLWFGLMFCSWLLAGIFSRKL